MSLKAPEKIPENGFYYHYKHDPQKDVGNYAYEVLGVGFHTEEDCRVEDKHLVVYRPLYESSVYTAGRFFDIRPLSMFLEKVTKNGKTFDRFTKITDPEILNQLREIKKEMYR